MDLAADGHWVGPLEISHPLVGKIIPEITLWAYLFGIPLGVLAVTAFLRRNLTWATECYFAMLMTGDIAAMIALPLHTFIKVPRPTFLRVCRPMQAVMTEIWATATGPDKKRRMWFDLGVCEDVVPPMDQDSERYLELRSQLTAFPSFTITTTFAMAMFIFLMMNAIIKPWANRGKKVSHFWVLMPVVAAPVGALLLAGILLGQHTHGMGVIVLSAILGIVSAMMSYCIWFCSLFDYDDNHLPRLQYKEKYEMPYPIDARGGRGGFQEGFVIGD
ncbi:MAG: hypothetical protein Q9186_004807 [Xanthomendoza sp. 1 TL-2023]